MPVKTRLAIETVVDLYVTVLQAFVNEKAAPELLDYQADLVSRLQDQIQNQVCCISYAN